MISNKDLAKALYERFKAFAIANNVDYVAAGKEYTADVNKPYLMESPLFGPDENIGEGDADLERQLGVYQIDVLIPKTDLGGRWNSLDLIGLLETEFKRGATAEYNGQSVQFLKSSLTPLGGTDTHFKHILSVNYSVLN